MRCVIGTATFSFAQNSAMKVSGSLGMDDESVMTVALIGSPKTEEYITLTGTAALKGYGPIIHCNKFMPFLRLMRSFYDWYRKIKVDISSTEFNESTTTEIILLKFEALDPTSSLGIVFSSFPSSSSCFSCHQFEQHLH